MYTKTMKPNHLSGTGKTTEASNATTRTAVISLM